MLRGQTIALLVFKSLMQRATTCDVIKVGKRPGLCVRKDRHPLLGSLEDYKYLDLTESVNSYRQRRVY